MLEQPDNKDIIVLCKSDAQGKNKLVFVHSMENIGTVQKETTNNTAYCNIYQSEPKSANELFLVNHEQAEILKYKTITRANVTMTVTE